jgi:diguanylate cyclase (GGDEF)-like protein
VRNAQPSTVQRRSSRRPGDQSARHRFNRQTIEILGLSLVLLATASAINALLPDLGSTLRPSEIWAMPILGVAFAATLLTVVRVEFRQNAILFSLSEIPLAFSIVFLTPVASVVCRVVASGLIFAFVKKPPIHKQLFNLALFAFETSIAYLVIRTILRPSAQSDIEIILAATLSVIAASAAGSVVVTIAVSRLLGDPLRRLIDDLKANWVIIVNGAMAGALLSVYLISPALAGLVMVPVVALWYMMRRHGLLGQQLRDLRAVHGFASRIGRSLDLDVIGDSATTEAGRLLRADHTMLVVRESAEGDRVFTTDGFPLVDPDIESRQWHELLNGSPVELTTGAAIQATGMDGFCALGPCIVALVDDDIGEMGIMLISRGQAAPNGFSSDDVDRVRGLTDQLAPSLRRSMLHRRIQHEARHDLLTGLPNRLSLQRYIAANAVGTTDGEHWYIMILDLDRFKEVNDTLGHHAGDELLIEFARRISSEIGQEGFVARLAGDEFAAVITAANEEEVMSRAQACVEAAREPITLDGLSLMVTASIGVAHIPAESSNAELPVRHADIAMYNAKSRHVGVEFFRPELDRRTPARLSMLGDLRRALDDGELDVAYQPQLNLASGLIVGVEALARWNHHARGAVSPADFIKVAEDTGLIKQLTDAMLARSIAELRHFHDAGHKLSLSVNLSTHDLLDAKLADRVAGHLSLNGVQPEFLTLEITESSLLVEAPRSRTTIQELHELGVHLSIDDFGTGYSSLSYLRQLPVSELKVDQSFVATMLVNQQDEVIVRSTIDLGHNLGLQVVAEGVECDQVLEQLRTIGCDSAQGYAVSRPLDAHHFSVWLNTSKHPSRLIDPSRPEWWTLPADAPEGPVEPERVR